MGNRKRKIITEEIDLLVEHGESIDGIIGVLQQARDDFPLDDLYIEWSEHSMTLLRHREETDEEYDSRIETRKSCKRKRESAERRLARQLLKKYGNAP